MKYALLLFLLMLGHVAAHGQTPTQLYQAKNYLGLAKLEPRADKLTAEELYMVGFAFFRLENDEKAIAFYNRAIAKGLDDGSVYFYKGLSLKYQKKYPEALKEIEAALKREPTNQEFMNEKGVIYYSQDRYDEALAVFEQAKKLPSTFPEPYYWVAQIEHEQKLLDKALPAYYEAIRYLPAGNSNYFNALSNVGLLEYTVAHDYKKSAAAYTKAIALKPSNYELHYKLMKALNAGQEYGRADSVFAVVKSAFEHNLLPKSDQEIQSVAIAEFKWNGRTAVVRRSLVDPKEVLAISYKVFLLDAAGSKVERRFVVEKTFELEKGGPKHLLCEQDKSTGGHITYPYGWSTDTIPLADLEKAVALVLDGKMQQSASSNFRQK
ncbi:tetratricopeptide repeat protein [Hymenobacter properus]|uniref:Tetratricopeptide repeat protein n=1 Tax=Hymenobacter properus TaxID=2791026 RepID=A0A931BGP3_9BACT|nr:tetratricopeptide repeat protein [Hymenobacter properus]MBF9142073.1 tetratricopeptide repeat protein [Hymenobacter properus]MBR7720880.1 tetratricopeptide repeat protein [Microvirga sp. SRT04]